MSPPANSRTQSGVSLIEVMVAAVIFGMSLTGVLNLLGMGATLDTGDALRRQARINAVNTLEQPQYQYANFAALKAAGAVSSDAAIIMKTSQGQDLPGNIHVDVTIPADASWNDPEDVTNSIPVPLVTIAVQVSWSLAGKAETLTLQKSISEMPL